MAWPNGVGALIEDYFLAHSFGDHLSSMYSRCPAIVPPLNSMWTRIVLFLDLVTVLSVLEGPRNC